MQTADAERTLTQVAAALARAASGLLGGDDRRATTGCARHRRSSRRFVCPTGCGSCPRWCAPVDADAINIALDPGLAFGTGTHPSTLCACGGSPTICGAGATVLDYGCGSGILSIAAAKLGASRVTGIDIDPQAIATSRANAAINGVTAEFGRPDNAARERRRRRGRKHSRQTPGDSGAALGGARARRRPAIVLSGILEAQADAVIAAYNRWFNIDHGDGRTDGWHWQECAARVDATARDARVDG